MSSEAKHMAVYVPSLRGGGAERVMVTLANGFAERGHIVDLVLAKAEGPYCNDVSDLVRIVDLGSPGVLKSLSGLVRYLRHERPKVMLSAMGHANVIAIIARSLAQLPMRVVLSVHTNTSMSQRNMRSIREWSVGLLMHWAYPRSDGVIAVSRGVADDLAENLGMLRSSIHVVYNPVVTDQLYELAMEPPEHSWFNPDRRPVLLGVGRLEPAKDFSTLIKAFARVRRHHNVRLVILGEGSLRSVLEAQVNELGLGDSVQLPGFVKNPYSLMRDSAVLVSSSAWEGFGNVLVEAMACGTPVVSTDCPSGPAEILGGGRWGRLVPVGDEVALAEAITTTLCEKGRPDVAQRAAEFGKDKAVDAYLTIMLPANSTGQLST